jgi:hypothetical protein
MPLTISHAKSNTIGDMTGTVTGWNNSGASTTFLATNLVRPSDWNSAHQLTLSLTGSEVASLFNFGAGLSSSSNASGVSAGLDFVDYFAPFIPANTNSTLSALGIGTWYFDPFLVPFNLNSGQICILNADVAGFQHGTSFSAASTGSVSRYQTLNQVLALYRLGAGASTTRLESIWSADCSFLATWDLRVGTANTSSGTISNFLTLSFPAQWNISGGVTYSSTTQSGTTAMTTSTMASTRANNLITGAVAYLSGSKALFFPFATSIVAGDYWMAHMVSSTSSSSGTAGGVGTAGTMFSTQSYIAMLEFVGQAYKQLGRSVSDSSTDFQQFHGSLATTTSAPTSIVGTADMRNFAVNHRLYWNHARSSY